MEMILNKKQSASAIEAALLHPLLSRSAHARSNAFSFVDYVGSDEFFVLPSCHGPLLFLFLAPIDDMLLLF
jgi:hypothetical protein